MEDAKEMLRKTGDIRCPNSLMIPALYTSRHTYITGLSR